MLEQLALRPELRPEWIEDAVARPDWVGPDPDPQLTRSYKSISGFGGRILRVM